MGHFTGKVAIVTGGASGIGRALCEQLGERGATVVVADVNKAGAEKVVSSISAAGGVATPAHTDVSKEEEVRELIDRTTAAHGKLDFMFNNAGIGVGGEVRDTPLEHWRRIFDINLYGVLYGTLMAYEVMIKQGSGHIVNTASGYGLMPGPVEAAYATTKHAVVGLSTSLRVEGADLGVKVSVVCPGFIETDIWQSATIFRADREEAVAQIPFKMMKAKDAGRAILSGVERNRQYIVFPFHARVLWRLNRLSPSLLKPVYAKLMRDFRTIRTGSEGSGEARAGQGGG
jgi:NAD(P)-dependent dehydrogenase (short-subunit alcohol dehydrogenase family)